MLSGVFLPLAHLPDHRYHGTRRALFNALLCCAQGEGIEEDVDDGEEGVWTHESQLPLWLMRSFEEALQRQEALAAQQAARAARAASNVPGGPEAVANCFAFVQPQCAELVLGPCLGLLSSSSSKMGDANIVKLSATNVLCGPCA